jgi:hypothetical protein
MNGKAFVTLAVATAFGVLSTSAIAKDDMDGGDRSDRSNRGEPSGSVLPCSLKGINPAAHPEIFGSPAVAASYGFVRSRNGTWQVRAGCRR